MKLRLDQFHVSTFVREAQCEEKSHGANDRVRIVDRNWPYVCEGLDLGCALCPSC